MRSQIGWPGGEAREISNIHVSGWTTAEFCVWVVHTEEDEVAIAGIKANQHLLPSIATSYAVVLMTSPQGDLAHRTHLALPSEASQAGIDTPQIEESQFMLWGEGMARLLQFRVGRDGWSSLTAFRT